MTAIRIVSLIPSVTESLLAWGITPIAVTRFCEQPSLRNVGGTKDPDIAAIVALAPDLVVMNDEENRREDAEALATAGISLHITHVHAVDDVLPCLNALAHAVGRSHLPLPVARLARERPIWRRAFVPIWRRPWMTINADTYGASILRCMGIDTVFATAADRYPVVAIDEVAALRPDLVLLPSEPYPFTLRHIEEFTDTAATVLLVDGKDLFWWGTRTAAAVERLARVLG